MDKTGRKLLSVKQRGRQPGYIRLEAEPHQKRGDKELYPTKATRKSAEPVIGGGERAVGARMQLRRECQWASAGSKPFEEGSHSVQRQRSQ